jgi:hypothetical protein
MFFSRNLTWRVSVSPKLQALIACSSGSLWKWKVLTAERMGSCISLGQRDQSFRAAIEVLTASRAVPYVSFSRQQHHLLRRKSAFHQLSLCARHTQFQIPQRQPSRRRCAKSHEPLRGSSRRLHDHHRRMERSQPALQHNASRLF